MPAASAAEGIAAELIELDFYLQPRADLTLDRDSDGSWLATLSVTITNAPRTQTSPYIEGFHPEQHYVFLDVHLPAGASEVDVQGDELRETRHGADPPMSAAVTIYPVRAGETKTVSV